MTNLKNLTCWIVTEGLKGTENQCLGITEALGVTPVIHKVGLRQPWKMLSPYLRLEHEGIFIPPLHGPWPDLLIASGRKSIAASRYIKKQSGGKCFTVQVQDPRVNPNEFDMVIAPSHDPVLGENVVSTIAAPNRIHAGALKGAAQSFPHLSALPGKRVAVLIGGNSKAHRLTAEVTARMAAQLKGLDASLMITTSRRTGAANEALLRDALQGDNIEFWDGNGENPYFAMLELADAIIVTSDSVSMLSEAATTGKPVYMIPLEGGGKRLDALQENLMQYGAVRIFDGNLMDWPYEPLNDAQIAADEIKQRLYNHMA